jgi:putative endonuclease
MYILRCSNNTYYTGSKVNLDKRLAEHNSKLGANYTKKWHPVKLVYYEEFQRIDEAFNREKQIQGWGHQKKEALINSNPELIHELAMCNNDSYHENNKLE